jgi:Na+/H+-dicarboxylate symporter
MTKWVIWISPVGVCFLIAGSLVKEKDLVEVLKSVGIYFCTVLVGLMIHGLIVLPIIYAESLEHFPSDI